MAGFNTYSFTDVTATISHPAYGSYDLQGEGMGDFNIAKNTDRTAHDVAADGTIMVSKIAGNNGVVTITAQQTSPIHFWLLDWYNTLWNLPTSEWATTSMLLRNTSTGGSHVITGVSPQKVGDIPYQQQGQRITWALMAADIQHNSK